MTKTMNVSMSKALALLTTEHTVQETADLMDWPPGAVRKLAEGRRGWLVGTDGRVTCPGAPGGRVPDPPGVDAAHLAWARQLKASTGREAARTEDMAPPARLTTVELPIDKIQGNPDNIRDDVGDVSDLAASIKAHGLLQPLTVRPHPMVPGGYELLAGHRRHVASIEAGLTTVPAIIRRDVDDATAVEVMLVENVQRRDLNPMEKAEALGKLRESGYSNALISARTGIPDSTVSYLLALLELDEAGRERVRSGELAASEAVAAVREFRKKQRAKNGGSTSSLAWEPDYLSKTHPLARRAERMCDAREHTSRRRIGKTACGQCWETVIRQDEQIVMAASRRHDPEEATR
ncbi:ParB/RepB/Spo0J family partition protein [Microbispora sp. CA-102843]|uniref:ParB/RepB/Spo0J family partition protein n=1 Tax=Microbispora sp. CA-102843 TaxID=3239952 RepID=UPI003D8B8A36